MGKYRPSPYMAGEHACSYFDGRAGSLVPHRLSRNMLGILSPARRFISRLEEQKRDYNRHRSWDYKDLSTEPFAPICRSDSRSRVDGLLRRPGMCILVVPVLGHRVVLGATPRGGMLLRRRQESRIATVGSAARPI